MSITGILNLNYGQRWGGGGGGLVEKFKYWFATLKNGTGAASILT